MNFDFSDEQKSFGEQVRRMLASCNALQDARDTLEEKIAYSQPIWNGLADLGCMAVMIPEDYGGLGLQGLELCVAAEEIGRSLAPVPMLASIYVCAEAIRLFGTETQKSRWLPGLANGTTIGTFAFQDFEDPNCVSIARLEDCQLSGVKSVVPFGTVASIAIVSAITPENEIRLFLCELNCEGIEKSTIPNVDPSSPIARVVFDRVKMEPLGQSGMTEFQVIRDRAAILLAFEQIGAADRAIEMARNYALERKSFGRPIGSYQAIKHKLATAYSKNQIARAHAYHGAWALTKASPVLPLAAAASRISAIEAFSFAAQENIQTHGGIGYTWDADCHLFYRRARQQALVLGSAQHWKTRLLRELRNGYGNGGLG